MSFADFSVRRVAAPGLIAALTSYAVVALSDPDVAISHTAAVTAGGAVGVAGFIATTLYLTRGEDRPWGALLASAGGLVVLTLLVLAIPLDDVESKRSRTGPPGSVQPNPSTAPSPSPSPEATKPNAPASDDVPTWVIVAVAVIVVALAFVAWRHFAARRTPLGPETGSPGREVESDDAEERQRARQADAVRQGLSRGRAELLDEDDPRLAVVRAYLAFERHVRRYGLVREPAETEAEYATRVLASGRLAAPERVHALVDLFNVARFSELPVGPDDARAARDHIDALVAAP
jgi:hypothetical protein